MKIDPLKTSLSQRHVLLVSGIVLSFSFLSQSRWFFGDDFCLYAARFFAEGCLGTGVLDEQSYIRTSLDFAKSQERFYQIIFFTLSQYLLSYPPVAMISKFIVTASICFFIYKIGTEIHSKHLGLVALLFFVCTYPLQGYNALTNLPGWFNLGVLLFLVYFHQFLVLEKSEGSNIFREIIVLLSFTISLLSYEIFVPIYLGLITYFYFRNRSLKETVSIKKTIRISLGAQTLILIMYLSTYLFFSYQWQGTYEGTDLAGFAPYSILKTLILFAIGGFLLSLFTGLGLYFRQIDASSIVGFSPLSDFSIESRMFAILIISAAIYTFFQLAKSCDTVCNQQRHLFPIFFLILAPGLLLSVTEKYQAWAASYPFYLSTLLSHIFICIVLALVYLRIHFKFRNSAIILVNFMVAVLLLVGISGQVSYFVQSQASNQQLQDLLEKWRGDVTLITMNEEERRDYFEELDRIIGSFPYRFSEVFQFRNKG